MMDLDVLQGVNLKDGGTIELENETLEIEPNPARIFGAVWKNGAMIEVLFYDQPLPDAPEEDRIHLLVRTGQGITKGLLMDTNEAVEIILGLSKALSVAGIANDLFKEVINAQE